MDFKDFVLAGALLASGVIIFTVLHFVATFISGLFGWDYLFTLMAIVITIVVASFGFGFFIMPGGEWFWKKERKEGNNSGAV